jgi:hypothetical protein
MIGSNRRGQEGRLLLPFEKVDDIKTTVGMSKKDSTVWGGCDPALLKSESEALPPPHETIPIDGPETTCRCHCDHTPQSSHLAEWSNQVFPAQAYPALFHIPFSSATILQRLPLQRLPFSSDCHSPATTILQRLPFSGDYHSPATAIPRRLPFSSDYHSPATTILQRLPFSSDYHSPATTILQRLPFNSTSYQESQLPIWKEP